MNGRKSKSKIIAFFSIVVVMLVLIVTISMYRANKTISNIDVETRRAINYETITDERVFYDEGDEQLTNKCDFVSFEAFYPTDLNGDGMAEKVLGACSQIGTSKALRIVVGVSQEGYLQDAKITLTGKNITFSMNAAKDSILKDNYVFKNLAHKEILLNRMDAGASKMLTADTKAMLVNDDSYCAVNSIILTGTYVDKDGNEHLVKKEYSITNDWYNNQGDFDVEFSKLSNTIEYSKYVEQEDKSIECTFKFSKVHNGVMPKYAHIEVEMAKLEDEYPENVICENGVYDKDNHKLIITNNTKEISAEYTFILQYSNTVYDAIVEKASQYNGYTMNMPVEGYYVCSNNPNEEFENPYTTETASANCYVNFITKNSSNAQYVFSTSFLDTKSVKYPNSAVAKDTISSKNLIDTYNKESDYTNVEYTTAWQVRRSDLNTNGKALVQMKDTENVGKYGDSLAGNYLQDYVNIKNIYFSNYDFIPSDGFIEIYDNDTNQLIKKFSYDDICVYNSSDNAYVFDGEVKHIVAVTSSLEPEAGALLNLIMTKEIDSAKVKEDFTRNQIENMEEMKTTLYGKTGTETGVYGNGINAFALCNFEPYKNYASVKLNPENISVADGKINETISIQVPKSSVIYSEWKNGIFVVELPSEILKYDVQNVTSTSSSVEICGYSWIENATNGKQLLKIVTSNEVPASGFTINITGDMYLDLTASSISAPIEVYADNEICNINYSSAHDIYDINMNGNTSDLVYYTSASINITEATGFVSRESLSNFDNNGSVTIAPNITNIEGNVRTSTVNVVVKNNYKEDVDNIVILGKIPFSGNSFIEGRELGSEFSTTMRDSGITIPTELKKYAKIYYSTIESPSKDLNDANNKWTIASDVTSFEDIKSYLIVLENYTLKNHSGYEFSYDVNIPENVETNAITYSCHIVYYDLHTEGGILQYTVQPSKLGIRVVDYYDMQLTKVKESTNLSIQGATYLVTEVLPEDADEDLMPQTKMVTSTSDGTLNFENLRVNQNYTIKEIRAPGNYELNDREVNFKLVKDTTGNLEFVSDNNYFEGIQVEKDLQGRATVKSKVEDVPKIELTITKYDEENNEPLNGVVYTINGTRYTTDAYGKISVPGLSFNKTNTIQESYAHNHYVDNTQYEFTINKDNNGVITVNGQSENFEQAEIENSDSKDLVKVGIKFTDRAIPLYNLKIVKVDEADENIKLENARFLIRKIDDGNSIITKTNENGEIDVNGLYKYVEGENITGIYTIQEYEAPSGYSNNEEIISFIVKNDDSGNIKVEFDKDNYETLNGYEFKDNTLAITIKNRALFRAKKVDIKTKQPLANAEFVIYKLDENGNTIGYATDENGKIIGTLNENGYYVLTTDKDGFLTAPLPNGSYKIMEVKAPEGYDVYIGAEIFTVTGGNKWTVDDFVVDYPEETNTETKIYTIEDLREFASQVNGGNSFGGKTVILMNDIDFNDDTSSVEFTPIGNSSNPFSGTFIGQGFKIKNLNINSNLEHVGLFGFAGGATINGVTVTGNIISDGGTVGGICGFAASSKILNCGNEATITSKMDNKADTSAVFVGGLVGNASGSTIECCYNSGKIDCKAYHSEFIGGIFGIGASSTNNCYNTGNIIVERYNKEYPGDAYTSVNVAGIGYTPCQNSYNIGNIEIEEELNGKAKVGRISTSTCTNAYYISTMPDNITYYSDSSVAKTAEEMKTAEFVNTLGSDIWSIKENVNNGFPIIDTVRDIYYVEDLVKFATAVSNGNEYTGQTVKLLRTIDINDESFYKNVSDTSYGDINGDGNATGIKDELTNAEKAGFRPIGLQIDISTNGYFCGTFDGQGNEIKNLYINRPDSGEVGLFKALKNAKVVNLTISGNINGSDYVGGICAVAYENVKLENCHNYCNITGHNHIAGIVGMKYAQSSPNDTIYITNCSNHGTINGSSRVAGIIANINSPTKGCYITDCINYGNITGEDTVAGICGNNNGTSFFVIDGCSNDSSAKIEVSQFYAGGIIAAINGNYNATIINCNNNANIIGNGDCDDIGGIIGITKDKTTGCDKYTTIYNCNNGGNITVSESEADAAIGGIIGGCFWKDDIIKYCYNTGKIENKRGITGGIAGFLYGKIENCYNVGEIKNGKRVGGIAGELRGEISKSYNNGKINITTPNDWGVEAGGICGFGANNTKIEYCYNLSDIEYNPVSGTDRLDLGGIAGTTSGSLSNCYNKGNISVNPTNYAYVGGILGRGDVSYCYNTGDITYSGNGSNSFAYIGGLVGSGLIELGYNAGNITYSRNSTTGYVDHIGGLTGMGSVQNGYNTGNIDSNVACDNNVGVYVGGIAGSLSGTNNAIYNTGNINNTITAQSEDRVVSFVGGLVGSVDTNASINGGYSTGNITNNAQVYENNAGTGIIAGKSINGTKVYYKNDSIVNGPNQPNTNNLIGLSSQQLKSEETYQELLPTSEYWRRVEGIYPFLEIPVYSVNEESGVSLTVEDMKFEFDITTEVGENVKGERTGGTITGTNNERYPSYLYKKFVETRAYGEDSTEQIVATPESGYQITNITINGDIYTYVADEDGKVTIPAGYFKNMDRNYNVVVTFAPANEVLTIKKVDDMNNAVEGAEFEIHQLEDASDPTNTSHLLNITGIITNQNGLAFQDLPYGKYEIIETKAPDGYIKSDEHVVHTIAEGTNNTITVVNQTKKKVIAHYYLSNTGTEYGNEAVKLADDEFVYGNIGEEYSTNIYTDIKGYNLLSENGEYMIPENATGKFQAQPINVYYYYEQKTVPYYIHYLYDGVEDESIRVTAEASVGSKIEEYTPHLKDGYKFERAINFPLEVNENEEKNHIYIAYESNEIEYKVKYLYENEDGTYTEDETALVTGTALFGSEISEYENKCKDGYVLNRAVTEDQAGDEHELPLVITNDSSKNYIKVYYQRLDIDYTVHYFYDGVENNYMKETNAAKYGTIVSQYTDKNIEGYKLERVNPQSIVISLNPEENVINVYYVKESYNYSVEYYYDNVKDETATKTGTAEYQTTFNNVSDIPEYVDGAKAGYEIDTTKGTDGVEGMPLTIGVTASENVVKIYYKTLTYNIDYVLDGGALEEGATNPSTYKVTTPDFKLNNPVKEGYTFKGWKLTKLNDEVQENPVASTSVTIEQGSTGNREYTATWEKNSYGYTIEYYYDNAKDETATKTGTAEYQTTFNNVSDIPEYVDGAKAGYEIDTTKGTDGVEGMPLTIGVTASENVVKIYYKTLTYNIDYVLDGGALEEGATNPSTYKVTTPDFKLNNPVKEGYTFKGWKLTKLNDEVQENPVASTSVTIEQGSTGNREYTATWEKNSYGYTIEYYYDDVKDEDATKTGTAEYQTTFNNVSDIPEYVDGAKAGYEIDTTKGTDGIEGLPLTISTDVNTNVIKVYYIRKSATVTVKYVDNLTGENIADPITMTGKVGNPYEVQRKTFEGYRLDEDNLPTNETGVYSEEGDTVTYKYVELRKYELEVRYVGNEDETNEAKIAVDFGDTHIEDYTTNGVLKVEDVELTDLGTTVYSVYEAEIPSYYDSIASEENPAKVTLTRRLNTEENKYEFVTEHDGRPGLSVKVDEENKKVIISLAYVIKDCDYSIEFYYDGVLKEEETQTKTAKYGDVIESYEAPTKEGYELDTAKGTNGIEGLPLTIAQTNNVIKVYYKNVERPRPPEQGRIVIKYVDNLTGEEIAKSTTMTGTIGNRYEVERPTFEGYRLDVENLPTNETGTYSKEGDTITYKYIELRKYELEARYTAGEDEIDEAKIAVDFGDIHIEDYTTNGILKIGDIELTELGREIYTVYEVKTPEYCKTIADKDNPEIVELEKQLNLEKSKYEFVPNYEKREGFNVIIDEENKKVIFDFTTVKNEKYDLAVKKFITNIDGTDITNREPKVIVSDEGKITYEGNNEIEKISNNQNVTYTIRMYNESDVRAKGKRVIEHIPDGLVFIPDNEVNKNFEWKMCKVDSNGRVSITENPEEADIVITDYLVGKTIGKFDIDTKTVNYLDVQAVFKVDESKIATEDRIIENRVQIMKNKNDDNTENNETTEKLYVKYFDLSVEKYIANVKVKTNDDERNIEVGYDKKDTLVKVDVKRSEQEQTKLIVTYGLLIKNVGEIPGYATEITDYIPEDFKLISTDIWMEEGNKATTKSLEDVLLNPGESTTVEVTFEWSLANGSIGSRINEAQITAYANEYDAKDITEDNKDNEEILVTVKTGSEVIKYIAMATLYVSIVALGVLVIKKKVVIRKK